MVVLVLFGIMPPNAPRSNHPAEHTVASDTAPAENPAPVTSLLAGAATDNTALPCAQMRITLTADTPLRAAFRDAQAMDWQIITTERAGSIHRVLWQTGARDMPWIITEETVDAHGARSGWFAYSASELYAEWDTTLTQNLPDGFQISPPPPFTRATRILLPEIGLAAFDAAVQHLQPMAARNHIQRNGILFPMSPSPTPNDPRLSEQWSLTQAAVLDAWQRTTGDPSVIIAVLDTGVDRSHPDFLHADGDNFWANPFEIAGNGMDDDGNGLIDDVNGWNFGANNPDVTDVDGHGTRMAGLIGAAGNNHFGISGVMQRVRILPIKMGDRGFTFTSVIQSIDYAIWLRQNGFPELLILNNSYGTTIPGTSPQGPHALRDAIVRADAAGLLFIASAGNSGVNMDTNPSQITYPAGFDVANIISVAASSSTDQLWSGSNYGSHHVDLAAPGVNILSTNRSDEFNLRSGTSEATALTAGVAGLVASIRPEMDARSLKRLLILTGDPVTALSDKTLSGRRLNAANAVRPRSLWLAENDMPQPWPAAPSEWLAPLPNTATSWLETYFHGQPNGNGPRPLGLYIQQIDGQLALGFARNPAATDVTWQLQSSPDLETWQTIDPIALDLPHDDESTTWAWLQIEPAYPQFLRLQISLQP